MITKSYTVLYLEGFNRYRPFLLESAIAEQNVNSLFGDPADLAQLLNVSTVDQLRYIFYKIKNDLPNGEVTQVLNQMIKSTEDMNYNDSVNKIVKLFRDVYGVNVSISNTRLVLKIYKAFQTPADLSQTPPPPLENFGVAYSTSTSTSAASTSAASTSAADVDSGSSGGVSVPPGPVVPGGTAAAGTAGYLDRLQRPDRLTSIGSMEPISAPGGPTYYVRISAGRYRPAVKADLAAGIPLFIKNPNPIAAIVNPYVKVSDEISRARRAGPVDQDAVNREMKAQGARRAQSFGPGGKRYEADGSVRRKSQFGGALGSLSNFLGDVGNTVSGRGTSSRGQ